MNMCELCHSEPAGRRWKEYRVCRDCADYLAWNESLTPEEHRLEEEAIGRYYQDGGSL